MPAHVSSSVVRVRYAETDQMGVAYHANYLAWFEVARTDWLRGQGWTYREMESHGSRLPVIEAHCEYRQSAVYDDEVEIRATGTMLSLVRLRFEYELVRKADAAIVARGYTVHAVTDLAGKPHKLPERVRTLFA